MEMLHDFIHINYTTVLLVVFMIVFLLSNVSFDKRTTHLFIKAISMSFMLVVVDSIESYTATWTEPSNLRILMSALGYTLRPMSIMYILLIIIRDKMFNLYLIYVPMIFNTLISFSAFFSDIAFSYDANNEFVRGPLGIIAYVTSGFYLVLLCYVSASYIKEKIYSEGLIVFAITFTSVLSIFLEVAYGFDGFINACIGVSITFYYVFYLVINLKNDPLTQVSNRHFYEIDVARNKENVSAVINIDLNDLKVLNDKYGHNYGDKALVTVANCMRRRLIHKSKLYRVGGDEFSILYFGNVMHAEAHLSKMMEEIQHDIQYTGYKCAMGLAVREKGEEFEKLLKRADKIMYDNKAKMKAGKTS